MNKRAEMESRSRADFALLTPRPQNGATMASVSHDEGSAPNNRRTVIAFAGVVLIAVFAWAYWPTIVYLISTWNSVPDYSHGFLVPLLSVFFLWQRRNDLPEFRLGLAWPGLALVLISLLMRVPAAILYIPTIDAWSMPVWIVGVLWTICGWRVARWSLPSALYLYFMVPLPFRMERWLSIPLRTIATNLSVWTLQCMGQPAVAEGHTIHLGVHRLEVEQACSGLRMLVGIAALATAYLLLFRKTWWERAILVASVLPVALAANTARIVATGLLYQYVSTEAGQKFTHDFAGIAMVIVAALLFGGVLLYLDRLFPETETVEIGDLLRRDPVGFK